jgi:hypothetical protein
VTVDEARVAYLGAALLAQIAERRCRDVFCGACRAAYLRTDAASIALDLANAEASIERTRQAIPWA